MAKNQESINKALFELLRSRGYAPTLLDTSGKEIPIPDEAEVFQFKFKKDDKEYGTVTLSIDGLHKLVVYFNDDVANSEKESTSDGSWYKLLNHLKRFAQQHQLSFDVKNTDHLKYDMAKREHMKKQERISEGYHPMGKAKSYSDAVPTTKIIIQHNKNIEEGEQRYRNVAKIFVENSEGERFAVPTTKPGIARVYARHIAEGGTPYDEKGKHITSLCEEYQKMGAFVRATRNGQFNESAQNLVNEGINHYQSLRETLGRMTGHRGYTAYFESWTPSLMEDETDTSNLNELFVQETLDPRIESVMPILSKLHKKVAEMKEVDALAEWADSLTEAPGAETLKHNDDTEESNLKAFGLAEDGADLEPAIDELEEDLDEGILDTVKKVGSKVFDKLGGGSEEDLLKDLQKKAGVRGMNHGKPSMAQSDVEKRTDEVDMGQADSSLRNDPKQNNDKMDHFTALGKASKKMGHDHFMDVPDDKLEALKAMVKRFRAGEEVDESALQAYLGDKKYGKDGMDALRKAGREHASKDKMQDIRAKYSHKEEVSEDGEFAGDYATGEAGQWRNKGPKAHKPATIGDLVGENFINTDAQAVVSEEETTHKGGKVTSKDGVTKHKSAPGVYGGYDDSTHPDSPEEKHPEPRGRKTGHDTDQIKKFKFSEGQEDLDALKRLLGK